MSGVHALHECGEDVTCLKIERGSRFVPMLTAWLTQAHAEFLTQSAAIFLGENGHLDQRMQSLDRGLAPLRRNN